jgi:hypothetical protein
LADGCGGKVSRARRIGDTAMLDDRDQTAQIAYIRKNFVLGKKNYRFSLLKRRT